MTLPPQAPFDTKPAPFDEQATKIAEKVQNLVTLAFGIGATLTAAGFAVVNSHLWRYTHIHGFNVTPSRYVAGGIWLLIFYMAILLFIFLISGTDFRILNFVLIPTWENRRLFSAAFLIRLVVLSLIVYFLTGMLSAVILFGLTFGTLAARSLIRRAIANPLSQSGAIVFTLFIAYAMVGGFVFSSSIYRQIYRSLGGGLPSTVYLIFHSADDLARAGLRAEAETPYQTVQVCLLTELTDGFLIYDPTNQNTFAIKNESVLAIRDDRTTIDCRPPALVIDSLLPGRGLLGN